MKVTLDIPDTTLCASLTIVYNAGALAMIATKVLDTKDLRSNEEIAFHPKEGEE